MKHMYSIISDVHLDVNICTMYNRCLELWLYQESIVLSVIQKRAL